MTRMPFFFPRPLGGIAAVLLTAALVLTGCSGSDKTDNGSASPSGGSTEGSDPSTTTEPTRPATKSAADANDAYGLELPPGVQLTALGTDLALGETARVAWQPNKKTVGVIAVTVTKLRRGTMKDFVGFTLDPATKQSTPYYVDARVKNIGRSDLSGMATPLYLVDGKNALVEASRFQSTFAPCAAKPLPEKFKAGKSAKVCLVYVAADHGTLTAISFRPNQKYDPIQWTGPITKAKPKKKG